MIVCSIKRLSYFSWLFTVLPVIVRTSFTIRPQPPSAACQIRAIAWSSVHFYPVQLFDRLSYVQPYTCRNRHVAVVAHESGVPHQCNRKFCARGCLRQVLINCVVFAHSS